MALPILNDTPKYELTIPSSNKTVRFRPYLVKEEKVLLMANESNDRNAIMSAMTDTVLACLQGAVTREELTMFDLEYMFIKIRAKSVGESVQLYYSCQECEEKNTVEINLDEVVCETNQTGGMIQLTDDISLEMAYPSYTDFDLETSDENEMGFEIIARSIKTVLTDEERIELAEESKENVQSFLESMTAAQFTKVAEFVKSMPAVKYESSFVCQGCGTNNEFEVRGMHNFFWHASPMKL